MRRMCMISVVAASLSGLLAAPSFALGSGGHPPKLGLETVLYAAPDGSPGPCAPSAPCTLQGAVEEAASGDTVVAFPGVYDENVVIEKQLRLRGLHATIDASSSPSGNGVQIVGPGGSGSTVEGFTIENAMFEGILVGTAPISPESEEGTPATEGQPVSEVRIANNVLLHNDTGFGSTAGQCFSTPEAPGDCGEGIHLVAVTDSIVERNYLAHNAGGVLLTDEFGSTSGNVIRRNRSIGNTHDCGITLAGHNPGAVNPATGEPTGAAGVFDNLIERNVVNGNGVEGQGAGILLGGGAPFAGVYGNTIRRNVAVGNGLSGITIHQHLVGDLNGNVIEGNRLVNDNVDGDFDFAAAADPYTTGILVASGAPPGPPLPPELLPGPISGTVIRGNLIMKVEVGIWTLGLDQASTQIAGNIFNPHVAPQISEN